ncbi:hypothetical protein B0H17DRAFT_1214743 [Mycena rosella]|uniref:DUF7025 domain-containing protein n=1 Tax=Mycena rosella TaxID=1033263 RepID=A0AAD7CN26_MYCRO|nr:hypothetical protein B0H17DRAFT_1214743 [Mycena rosella]
MPEGHCFQHSIFYTIGVVGPREQRLRRHGLTHAQVLIDPGEVKCSLGLTPFQLDPEIFLTFLHIFIAYRDALAERKHKSEQEAAAALVAKILSSVNLLIFFLSADYRSTIATVEHLTAHREITFDLLYAIFIPRTLVVARCAVTGLECIFQLQQAMHTCQGVPVYQLTLGSTLFTTLTQRAGGRLGALLWRCLTP